MMRYVGQSLDLKKRLLLLFQDDFEPLFFGLTCDDKASVDLSRSIYWEFCTMGLVPLD